MKHSFFISCLLASGLALGSLAGCSKDSADPKGMSWTLDGSNVTAGETTAYTSSSSTNNLVIAGRRDKGNTYPQVFFVVPKRSGTFDLSGNDVAGYYLESSTSAYEAVTGSVALTKYSTSNVSGTFTFTGEKTTSTARKSVTNGKFNIDY